LCYPSFSIGNLAAIIAHVVAGVIAITIQPTAAYATTTDLVVLVVFLAEVRVEVHEQPHRFLAALPRSPAHCWLLAQNEM